MTMMIMTMMMMTTMMVLTQMMMTVGVFEIVVVRCNSLSWIILVALWQDICLEGGRCGDCSVISHAESCQFLNNWLSSGYLLIGLVVKASALRPADPVFDSCLRGFSRLSHTCHLEIGTPVASLPSAWHYRISAGTGCPSVSILWLGEVESLLCNFYLSVAVRKIVWADPSLRYTGILMGH